MGLRRIDVAGDAGIGYLWIVVDDGNVVGGNELAPLTDIIFMDTFRSWTDVIVRGIHWMNCMKA